MRIYFSLMHGFGSIETFSQLRLHVFAAVVATCLYYSRVGIRASQPLCFVLIVVAVVARGVII